MGACTACSPAAHCRVDAPWNTGALAHVHLFVQVSGRGGCIARELTTGTGSFGVRGVLATQRLGACFQRSLRLVRQPKSRRRSTPAGAEAATEADRTLFKLPRSAYVTADDASEYLLERVRCVRSTAHRRLRCACDGRGARNAGVPLARRRCLAATVWSA